MGTQERWIGALKSAGEAPLDEALMAELDRATDAALGRCKTLCVAGGLIVCVLGAGVLLAPMLGKKDLTFGLAALSGFVGLMVCLAAGSSVLHARRVRRMAALVRQDGRVERFVLSPARIEGLVAAKALGLALSDAEPATADIYCATGTLARLDERCAPFNHPKIMEPVEVWEGERGGEVGTPIARDSGPEHVDGGRALAEAERVEITGLLSRQSQEVAKWAIIAVLCAGFAALTGFEVVSQLVRGRSFPIAMTLWGLAAVGGLAGSAWMLIGEVVGRVRVSRSLRDTGLVRLSQEDIRRESSPNRARGVMVDSAECLGPSGIVWTVEGEPAEWRTAPDRGSLRGLPRSRTVLERGGATA